MQRFYKPNFEATMERLHRFYSDDVKNGALIKIGSIAQWPGRENTPCVRPLNQWDFDTQLEDFIQALVDRTKYMWIPRSDIDDDEIPCVYPRFGIAEHSAYLGGEVVIEKETSYHKPIIKEWSDVDNLALDPENIWFKRVIRGLELIQQLGGNDVAVRLRGGCSPTELANFIRGNDLFTDFYEYPEEVKHMLEFCTKAERWFIDEQLKAVDPICGGYISGQDVWMPGNSFGHLSEDWSTMCSPAMYEEFGRPYTEKLIEGFEHTIMHVHSVGRHVLPNIASINGLTHIQISGDPNSIRAIEVVREYSDILSDKYINITLTYDELKENLDLLKDKKSILVMNAASIEEAKELVAFVRENLPF